MHVGKESNNLDESEIIGVSDNDYVVYDNADNGKITHILSKMTLSDAQKIGISRRNFFYLKKKVNDGKELRFKKKTIRHLA